MSYMDPNRRQSTPEEKASVLQHTNDRLRKQRDAAYKLLQKLCDFLRDGTSSSVEEIQAKAEALLKENHIPMMSTETEELRSLCARQTERIQILKARCNRNGKTIHALTNKKRIPEGGP